MKVYNVEIFDRNFNFLYNTIIGEEEFVYKFDIVSPEKNTIKVPTSFDPSSLSNNPTAPRGWYITIYEDVPLSNNYHNALAVDGVITGFEYGETQGTIEYSQTITLFNAKIWVYSQDIIKETIPRFIVNTLTRNFIDVTDTDRQIPGLSVVNNGGTNQPSGRGLDYSNTTDEIVVIDILHDLLIPAFTSYGYYTDTHFFIANNSGMEESKSVLATVRNSNTDSGTIEADLPNIIESSFTIRKSTNNEVNTVAVKDIYSGSILEAYLYTDGTYGYDPAPTGKTRITPVIYDTILNDDYSLAKEIVDSKYNEYLKALELYAIGHFYLQPTEFQKLKAATDVLMPIYQNLVGFGSYSFNKIYDSPPGGSADVFDFTVSSPPIITSITPIVQDVSEADIYGNKFDHYGPANKNICYGYQYDQQYNFYGHAMFRVNIDVGGSYDYGSSTISGDFSTHDFIPFDHDAGSKAVAAYKLTSDYASEIVAALSSQQILDIKESKIKNIFAKNNASMLIELTVDKYDKRIQPLGREVGRRYRIYHNGQYYFAVLTGKEIRKDTVKLIFGSLRLELTKLLNLKGV